ncbi:MAG TPA: hypothetical protein VJN43_00720 [Bryobacteraceae bacterium]|nr:hypothetical protein [Bryobacteraceae bacterium]
MSRMRFIAGVFTAFVLGAGGGMVSSRLSAQPAAAAAEIKAGSFVLVDAEGNRRAVLGFDKSGQPNLSIYDNRGHTVWTTRSGVFPLEAH